jgi:phage protein U
MIIGTFSNASFPNVPFGVRETLGLEQTYDYNFSVIPKLVGLPQIQAVARKPDTGELKLRFSDAYNTNPNNAFLTFKNLADARLQAALTIGGIYQGDYVITRITKTTTLMSTDGRPYEIDCTVSLLRVS